MNNSDRHEWKECKLGDLGVVITGKTPSSNNPNDFGNDIPFVTPTDYKNYNKKVSSSDRLLSSAGANVLRNKILPPKSVMVTCIGSDMGKVAINEVPVITNQQINSIIPDRGKVDPDFLYYGLVESYEILRAYGLAGTAVPIVNKTDFEGIDIALPPLPEQRAIADVLSSLDDKIDLLQRQNKTLEGMADALWRKMFVEEADPGWKRGKLGDLIELCYGKGLKEEKRILGNYPVLGSSGIVGYHNEFLVKGPGIVIGRKGTLGVVSYIEENFFPIDTTYFIKSKTNSGRLFFEYFLLKEFSFDEMNSDSAVPGLNREIAQSMEYTVPDVKAILGFNEWCQPLFAKKIGNDKQIRTLSRLRDTLLPKLMSGEVGVKL